MCNVFCIRTKCGGNSGAKLKVTFAFASKRREGSIENAKVECPADET